MKRSSSTPFTTTASVPLPRTANTGAVALGEAATTSASSSRAASSCCQPSIERVRWAVVSTRRTT
jgi:hypothetical protein